MEDKNMTALVSCFVKAWHYKNNKFRIYSDPFAEKILTKNEYDYISENMVNGIKFFNRNFKGDKKSALRWIVDNQLSPSVLGRSAFCERMLQNEIRLGCRQYLIYASGYDTSWCKEKFKDLKVFELDKNDVIKDKIKRLNNLEINNNVKFIECDFTKENLINNLLCTDYEKSEKSFNSLLGISYYLSKEDFNNMISKISSVISFGSGLVFDYQTFDESEETMKNELLAQEANQEMKSKYNYKEIEKILEDNNLYVYEHLNSKQMTNELFYDYNTLNPNNKIIAPKGVAYCYAVKR